MCPPQTAPPKRQFFVFLGLIGTAWLLYLPVVGWAAIQAAVWNQTMLITVSGHTYPSSRTASPDEWRPSQTVDEVFSFTLLGALAALLWPRRFAKLARSSEGSLVNSYEDL